MNPLAALQLRDQREQSSWAAIEQAMNDLGNLDTHLKDRYLTTGQGRFGVFGGQPQSESEWQSVFGKKPDLADIHRSAKTRGLLHDQATIDEKTQRPIRELEEQKQIGTVLKQEQQNLDTRRAGIRNSISQLYTALAQETDPENKRAIQKQIATLEAEGNTIGQDMQNVVNLMDSHNVPDQYYRRQNRSEIAPAAQAGEITDTDMEAIDSFVNSVATDTNTHYNESQVRALLAQAGLGNLKPFAKHISNALEAKQKFFIGRETEDLEARKAAQTLTKGATGLTKDKAELAAEIKGTESSINNLKSFIAKPEYANWKIVATEFSKLPTAEQTSLSKIPYVGNFLRMLENGDVNEASFNQNREAYAKIAADIISKKQAYLNELKPQPKTIGKKSVNAGEL